MSSKHSISNSAKFQKSLAALPAATYRAGETVLAAGSATGRLLILKEGAVTVVKEGVEIAKVTEPGAVFGELSTLLGQPHTADVHALEDSKFHVATTAAPLMQDPIALLYVATLLARRVDSANRDLVELKRQESRNRWKPPSPACHLALVRSEAQRSTETSVRPDRDF